MAVCDTLLFCFLNIGPQHIPQLVCFFTFLTHVFIAGEEETQRKIGQATSFCNIFCMGSHVNMKGGTVLVIDFL